MAYAANSTFWIIKGKAQRICDDGRFNMDVTLTLLSAFLTVPDKRQQNSCPQMHSYIQKHNIKAEITIQNHCIIVFTITEQYLEKVPENDQMPCRSLSVSTKPLC